LDEASSVEGGGDGEKTGMEVNDWMRREMEGAGDET